MPATGSSTNSNLGSCASSMPISSHCFWPCDRLPANRLRESFRRMVSSTRSMRSDSSLVSRQNSVPLTLWSTLSASSRLSSTVWLSNTVGFWNFRPIPSSAIRVSSSWVRSTEPSKYTSPSSGLVLPVMMSIIVVFPAPLGPMMARISPGSRTSDRLLMAWKPSNETCTPSRYSSAEVMRFCLISAARVAAASVSTAECPATGVSITVMRLLRHLGFADAVFGRGALSGIRSQAAPRLPRLPPGIQSADDALRQQQGHQDEQCAQHEQPVRRQRARREDGLGVVDDDRSQGGADQGAAAADRNPDHRLDRIAGRELAGIDDPDLWHVERAGDACHAGR